MPNIEFLLYESDYAALDDCPLLWRWTDRKYALLSQDELSQIRPLNDCAAKRANSLAKSFISDASHCLSLKLFEPPSDFDTSGDSANGRHWLERITHSLSPNEYIVVTWQRDLAVVTKLWLFVKHWDDFCYPSSDDTTVFPLDVSWVIQYWHEGTLHFASKKTLLG